MTTAGFDIQHDAGGWPYLVGSNYLQALPAYSQDLKNKLAAGDADVAAAINAAAAAQAAAAQAAAAQAAAQAAAAITTFPADQRVIVGTVPPAGTPRIRQRFTVKAVMENDSGASLPFPTPFPNALVSCVLTLISGASRFEPFPAGVSLSRFYCIALGPTGAAVGQSARVIVSVDAEGY